MRTSLVFGIAFLSSACTLFDNQAVKRTASTGLIATPVSYYSTAKAKHLATKYKENLDRIVEKIARNPKTSVLQFANNISSVGGIGFFTHSVTKSPDERYLEVVLATPESFELSTNISSKVHQLFSRYGPELLGILSGDAEIYGEKEVSGYGLNLTWHNLAGARPEARVTLARAIVYLAKEKALSFLRKEIDQNELLAEAVIFAVDEDGPLNLVSYKPQTPRPELRPVIREDDLTGFSVAAGQSPAQSGVPSDERRTAKQNVEQNTQAAKREERTRVFGPKLSLRENKAEAEKAAVMESKSAATVSPVTEQRKGAPMVVTDAPKAPASSPETETGSTNKPKDTFVASPLATEVAEKQTRAEKASEVMPTLGLAEEAGLQTPALRPPVKLPIDEKGGQSQISGAAVMEQPRGLLAHLGSGTDQGSAPTPIAKASTPSSAQEKTKVPTTVETKILRPLADRPQAVRPKSSAASVQARGAGSAASSQRETSADKPSTEQVALLSKPLEPAIEIKPQLALPQPKALEGFVIQLAFGDKEKARHWAETLQRRGYAVSLSEGGTDGALRVRLGNFAVREDAERQLRNLKQDGLTGIVINLPQPYRPEARSSVP